jgi:AraC-like DNA-binding protein
MGGLRKSTGVCSEAGVAPSPTNKAAAVLPAQLFPSGEPLLQHKYRELIRKHLSKLLDALFAEFTGVHFHVAWAPPLPQHWNFRTLLPGLALLPECRNCGPRQLTRALSAKGDGHRFTCRLGVRNYWVPIRVRNEMLGIAYLQALESCSARPLAAKRSARVVHAALRRAGARVLNRARFARSARFLQLIVQHVQSATLSDLRKADLTSAGRAVLALEKEQERLHQTLQRHLPAPPPVARPLGPESHAEQIVHGLLERIELDYGKPITLQQYARELGMNATYLSNLFSRAVGVPFKAYLTDLRLQKSRELLGDPAKTAAEVAYAVGYASENRFRLAFKKATGLCPRLWRQTMQTNPSR